MATNKFKFRLLTGSDPDAQYAAITTKDAYTFYLLGNGKGYFGTVELFGGTGGGSGSSVAMQHGGALTPADVVADKLYALHDVQYTSSDSSTNTITGLFYFDGTDLVSYTDEGFLDSLKTHMATAMTTEGYTGDDNTVPSTKAVVDLIAAKLGDADILNAQFFRKVVSHTVAAEELTNANYSFPDGTVAGDVGLLFTADNDNADDSDEKFYFIGLKDYIKAYTVGNTDSVTMALDGTTNTITASVKIADNEASIVVNNEASGHQGIALVKTNGVINDGDGTATDSEGAVIPSPSADKLVTEADMVKYVQDGVLTAVEEAITESLADVVTYSEAPTA